MADKYKVGQEVWFQTTYEQANLMGQYYEPDKKVSFKGIVKSVKGDQYVCKTEGYGEHTVSEKQINAGMRDFAKIEKFRKEQAESEEKRKKEAEEREKA